MGGTSGIPDSQLRSAMSAHEASTTESPAIWWMGIDSCNTADAMNGRTAGPTRERMDARTGPTLANPA